MADQPVFIANGTPVYTTAGSVAVSFPAGVQAGDTALLLATTADLNGVQIPDGWTPVEPTFFVPATNGTTTSNGLTVNAYLYTLTSDAPSPATLQRVSGTAYVAAEILVFRGVDPDFSKSTGTRRRYDTLGNISVWPDQDVASPADALEIGLLAARGTNPSVAVSTALTLLDTIGSTTVNAHIYSGNLVGTIGQLDPSGTTQNAVVLSVALAAASSTPPADGGGDTGGGSDNTPKHILLTSGTTWTVPDDWNSANNTVECIGSGADGATSGGGGGGAWARKNNIALTPGATVSYQIGTPSATQSITDTWLGSTAIVKAVGAIDSASAPASACVGDAAYSGGDLLAYGSGGGGAAGSSGNGENAGPGYTSGSTSHGGPGGAGDAGNGGAGGVGAFGSTNGADGSPGSEWGEFGGSGGGGGGSCNGLAAGNGGLFGGGGGGTGGTGAPGAIFITYIPAATPPISGTLSTTFSMAGTLEGIGELAGDLSLGTTLSGDLTGIGLSVPVEVDHVPLDTTAGQTLVPLVDAQGREITSDAVVTSLRRTDWRGPVELSPDPRTNLAAYSNDLSQWEPTGVAFEAGNPAPDGIGTMTRFVAIYGTLARVQMDTAAVLGEPYTLSIYVRRDQHRYVRLFGFGNGGDGVVFDLSDNSYVIYTEWDSAGVEVVSDTVVRVYGTVTPSSSGLINLGLGTEPGGSFIGGETLDFWGAQFEPGTAPTPLIVTDTAARTLTDYTLVDGNSVLLGEAADGVAAYDWSGTGTVGGLGPAEMSGALALSFGLSGDLIGMLSGDLAGDLSLSFGLTGDLTAAPPGYMSGSLSTTFGLAGDLTGLGALAGALRMQSSLAGALNDASIVLKPIAGAVKMTFGLSGDLTGYRPPVMYDKFVAYYTAKQALLDQMLEVARVTGSDLNDALTVLEGEISDAQAQADAANAELAKIASDGVLSKTEKTIVIRDANVLFAEQSGIDLQAAAFGVTTQKTAYDSKIAALENYLDSLTTPTAWDDLTGTTDINGAAFRAAFADAYTARQALLNAIYAAAKAKADAAQQTADEAHSLASQVAVLNPGFDAGDTGWSKESGWSIKSDGSFGVGQGYAEHFGGQADAALRNNAICFVEPGKSYKVQALIRAIGANGVCYARISWRNLSDVEIGFTAGNTITGNTTDGSYATGQAPSGAVFAHAEIATDNHTTGRYQVDNVVSSLQPATADEIAESSGRKWAGESGATVGGDWNSNVRNKPQAVGANLMWHGDFASDVSAPDVWSSDGTLGIHYPGGLQFDHALYTRGRDAYETDNWMPVKPNEVLFLSGYFSAGTVPIKFGLHFHDKNGNATWVQGISHASGWSYRSGTVKVPAGCVLMRPWLGQDIGAGSESSTGIAALLDIQRTALAQDGSGYRLGGLRNQVMAGVGNFASGWSGGTITYSATSTSATLTASAASLQIGGTSISYNQSSTTVSGSAGQAKTYYLYYDDDDYTGGSKSLNATTNQITSLSADGRVLVGNITVTFPTSGTGSGGGATTCPDENAWVLRADPNGIRPDWPVQAKTVRAGHYLRLTDGRTGCVTYSERKAAPRVRVFDENGATLTCSTSAPLELAGTSGKCVLAPESAGQQIKARAEGVVFEPLVWKAEDAGPGYVQHITCQNACFWTGDDPDYLFGHHNLKQPRDPTL